MLIRNIELEKKACMIVNWYDLFRKNTIKACIVPVPADVVEYLRQDMLILPAECSNISSNVSASEGYQTTHFNAFDDQFGDSDGDDQDPPESQPTFPAFSKTLTDAIRSLGGSAFLKSDWHCPKDAQWITLGQSLCVRDITDAYLLLKASSCCKEDFRERCDGSGFHVVLKKWKDIHPGSEFRCFVRNRSLLAISPRHWPSYHEHIACERSDIVNDIVSLFKEKIKETFPLKDYVFDVYRPAKDNVIIMDFSLYGKGHSESLAFDYEQLDEDASVATIEEEDDPEFRYLPNDCGIQPIKRNVYGYPQDFSNFFQNAAPAEGSVQGESNNLVNRLIEQCSLQNQQDGSDSTGDRV
ncbi:cell division cycle protein 123 homolog isoform X1 [Anopheles bellator]|uniref:cell division cycle protein 123 homolog isoform X1 n=2 Tax=Anopheles bellator TaxID=139047 RepID=UPI002649A27A|nr:cell division cycle protein 123 homolog isoform X1 [Anopheles bellator]XP_058062021.1 cell division cycle protein 123 homolog isoform X1 [Anopheles bellator]